MQSGQKIWPEPSNHGSSPLLRADYQRPAPHSSHVRPGMLSRDKSFHIRGEYRRFYIDDEPMLSRDATDNDGVTASRQLYKVIQDAVGTTFCTSKRAFHIHWCCLCG